METPPSPQACLIIRDAFEEFEGMVNANNPSHAATFNSITLEDVCNSCRALEKEMAARQCLRNMRRINPFLQGLEKYSKVVDVLCNGTDYLPWIWAPVKLFLQLASDYTTALEKLISSYGKIAEVLPRFDRLSTTFKENHNFQRILAIVYADILDFHRETYKFFQKRGWRMFFDTLWARFDRRFNGVLESLSRHTELVDKEANSIDISEAKEWRAQAIDNAARQEQDRAIAMFHSVLSWLEIKDYEQEDELERLHNFHHPHSCDWIQKHLKVRSWLRLSKGEPVLWIHGKPGAGKSVLSSMIIRLVQQHKQSTVLYYFCNYQSSSFNKSSHILRCLTAQLLRSNKDLAAYVYDEYIRQGLNSSTLQFKRLIPALLSSLPSVRIVIDGLDEFDRIHQDQILKDLLPFASARNAESICKILFTSRDIVPISKHLAKYSKICLSDERDSIDVAIQSFIKDSLVDIRHNLDDKRIGSLEMGKIEQDLIEKAEGMFLWVRLVLHTLDNVHNIQQLRNAVRELPRGVKKIYERIISHIKQNLETRDRDVATRILEWMTFAKRPLKRYELLDGISLHSGNNILSNETRLWDQVIDICKPLIENGPNGSVVFVHFTVQEYLADSHENGLIRPAAAQCNIAFACLAYLRSSFDLIDPRLQEHSNIIRVAKGFHGLFTYANEHWINHLFACAEIGNTHNFETRNRLLGQLTEMAAGHKRMESMLSKPTVLDLPIAEGTEIPRYLVFLGSYPDAKALLYASLEFRRTLRSEEAESGEDLERLGLAQDPTLFSQISSRYNGIVQHLLGSCNVQGLDQELLTSFKQTYGSSAFTCRFHGCPRRIEGYPSGRERDEHETLKHTGGIKCIEPSCPYRIGFKTSTALKRHIQQYHTSQTNNTYSTGVIRRHHICKWATQSGAVGCGKRFTNESQLQAHLASDGGQKCRLEDDSSFVNFIQGRDPQFTDTDPAQKKLELNSESEQSQPVERLDKLAQKHGEAQEEVISLYERSKNADFRQRPKYKEVQEAMDGLNELSSKPSGTIDLEKEQKRHEDWMRRGKKLFGKANAPLHILHNHMKTVEEKNRACFDLADQPRMPVEPSSREHTPDDSQDVDGSGSSRDVFCICRKPEAGMMIECELCHEWYHGKCLKIARGKVKEDDKYTCPICDYRVKIPRDATRPKLEDLQAWQDELLTLPFQPEEEDTLKAIISHGLNFRDWVGKYINPLMSSPDELTTQRFYLRKLEGADILLSNEINFFRQELHKWAPVAPQPPPIIEVSLSARKPRPTKQQRLMSQLGIINPEDLPQHFRTKQHSFKQRKSNALGPSKTPPGVG